MTELKNALHKYFNFDEFRPGQREVIKEVLAKKDILTVMPTGQGKSLCYQLPAFIQSGITLVISPLVALMKDQVDALWAKKLDRVTLINSQIDFDEQQKRMTGLRQGKYKLVYIAPERLRNNRFIEQLYNIKVDLLVIDEAHCLSQWGHDFRPDYLVIKEFYQKLAHRPTILALTATATPEVQKDILQHLGIPEARVIHRGSDRPNLYMEIYWADKERDKFPLLKEIIKNERESGIIYVATRKDSERVSDWLTKHLGIKSAAYHAGLDKDERNRIQEDFIQGKITTVVATNAFGMGIDKGNIRFVIHYCLPSSLEAYYQEIGRAGRDGLPSRCFLLYTPKDIILQEWIIDNDAVKREDLVNFWRCLKEHICNGVAVIPIQYMEKYNLTETKQRLMISMLEKRQVIRLIEREPESLTLEMGIVRPSSSIMKSVLAEAEKRINFRKSKLNAVVNWIKGSSCRREVLLNYFGEEMLNKPEDCCDICKKHKRMNLIESPLPIEILKCVKELQRNVGRTKLADILRGSRAKDILQNDYDKTPLYGKMHLYKTKEILRLIDQLIGDGYLSLQGDEYPVVTLTALGHKALENKKTLPVWEDIILRSDEPKPVDELSVKILAALKDYRTKLSKEEQKSPCIYFHDRVLEQIAELQPRTLAQLRLINGMGEKKVTTYGQDILEIISKYTGVKEIQSEEAEAKKIRLSKESILNRVKELYQQGLNIEQITKEISRSQSTVEGYLVQLVAEGRINVDSLVPWSIRKQIYLAMEQVGLARLKRIKEKLPDNISYYQIRLVRAALQKNIEN
ncbi:RecQ family ATP-dependent DNA helicase [Desulfolucanica intricata]|uniref:RecQ family ATP-dependent DNA helicase n=1 Tax=Desulfolucanica intricata TaxID=1285191 RepID=UPI0009EE55FF|nr:RecQ family ATP-dependent DNA helicase [Desulfolucanica intricata]